MIWLDIRRYCRSQQSYPKNKNAKKDPSMSVELLDNPRFYGFRVRRQIDGKTYQEYFSLKENSKRMRGAKKSRGEDLGGRA